MTLSQSYQARAISTARFLLDKEEKAALPTKEEVQHKHVWDAAKKLVVDLPPEKPPEDPLQSPLGSMTPNSRAANHNRSVSPKPSISPKQGSAKLLAQTSKLWETRDGSLGGAGSSSKDNTLQDKAHEVAAGSDGNISSSGVQDLRRQHSGGPSVQRHGSKLQLPELRLASFSAASEATNAARPLLAKSAAAIQQYRNSDSRDSDADSTLSSETSEADLVTSRPKRFSDGQTQPRVSFTDSVPALKHSSSLQSGQSHQTAPMVLGPPPVASRSRSSVELMRLRHLLENSTDSYSTAARARIRAGNMQQQWPTAIGDETGDSNSSDWRPIRRTASANAVEKVAPPTQSAATAGSTAAVRRSNSPLNLLVDVSDSIIDSGYGSAPVSVTSSGPKTLLWPTHGPTGGSAQKGQQLQHAATFSGSGGKSTVASASALAAAASQATTTTPAASQPTTTAGKLAAVVQRVFSGHRSHINRPNSHKTGYKNQSLGFRPHDAPVELMNERAEMAVSEMDSTRYDTIMAGLVEKQPHSKSGTQLHRQGSH